MRVLAFDTATSATAVALGDVGRAAGAADLELEARDDPQAGARPGHARKLLVLIEQVLEPVGGWDTVERIAVGIGPGTFTGLRIGIATAHALARSRRLELVGISTLQSLAVAARAADGDAAILALIDARRGEAFVAAWAAGSDPASEPPEREPSPLGSERLAAACEQLTAARGRVGPRIIAVGDGAVKFRVALEHAGVEVVPDNSPLHRVNARVHCRLAVTARPGAADMVLPAYLRLPDAELARPA